LELTFFHNQDKFTQPSYEERLFDHLGFEVSDINKTLEVMRKENVVITDEPFKFNEKTTIAFIEDPDGTLIELIERKRAELTQAIDKTFKIIIATDEDRLMASLLLWDDGRIEIHYRDYHPQDTSLSARSAVRIYQAISRSREDHKKVGRDEYAKRMMNEHAPNPDKIIGDAIRAMLNKKE